MMMRNIFILLPSRVTSEVGQAVPDEISDRNLLILFSELLTFGATTKHSSINAAINVRHSLSYTTAAPTH